VSYCGRQYEQVKYTEVMSCVLLSGAWYVCYVVYMLLQSDAHSCDLNSLVTNPSVAGIVTLKQGRIHGPARLKNRQAHPVRNRGNRLFPQIGSDSRFFLIFSSFFIIFIDFYHKE